MQWRIGVIQHASRMEIVMLFAGHRSRCVVLANRSTRRPLDGIHAAAQPGLCRGQIIFPEGYPLPEMVPIL